MSNPHRILAKLHKEDNLADTRSIDELEKYYHDLSFNSPMGRLCSGLIAADKATNAIEFAKLTAKQV